MENIFREGALSQASVVKESLTTAADNKLNALRDALIAGENSGFPDTFDGAEFLNKMRTKTHNRKNT